MTLQADSSLFCFFIWNNPRCDSSERTGRQLWDLWVPERECSSSRSDISIQDRSHCTSLASGLVAGSSAPCSFCLEDGRRLRHLAEKHKDNTMWRVRRWRWRVGFQRHQPVTDQTHEQRNEEQRQSAGDKDPLPGFWPGEQIFILSVTTSTTTTVTTTDDYYYYWLYYYHYWLLLLTTLQFNNYYYHQELSLNIFNWQNKIMSPPAPSVDVEFNPERQNSPHFTQSTIVNIAILLNIKY